ncbi:MAG: hypothetical protein WA001_01325 [Patescibacteria group bacterium]
MDTKTVQMSTETHPLRELTSYEIIVGSMLTLGPARIPRQALFELFYTLQQEHPYLRRMFDVHGSRGCYRSKPLDRTISFMLMYHILVDVAYDMPEDVYRLRRGMRDVVEGKLKEHPDFAQHQVIFRRLADRLAQIPGVMLS